MVDLSFLIFRSVYTSSIFPAIDLLKHANAISLENTGEEVFEIQLVGYNTLDFKLDEKVSIRCDLTIEDIQKTDLIIIPGFDPLAFNSVNFSEFTELFNWIKRKSQRGCIIASLCSGAVLLGHAGLLKDREYTTHWLCTEFMKQKFPQAKQKPDLTVINSENIYSSGGALSSTQLILHLIEMNCNSNMAEQIAKMAGIQYPLTSQSQFYIFTPQKKHTDKLILEIQNYLEDNYAEQISIDQLAEKVNMSPRNFIRRFKKVTNDTPLAYLQKVRIEAAKMKLKKEKGSVKEIMFDVGYSDLKSFSFLFKRLTGFTPAAYAKK